MKTVFMGSPDFALMVLDALVASDHEVVAVVSGEDKPKGRKRVITPTPVKARAESLGIPVFTPARLDDATFLESFQSVGADVAVVASFGKLLKRELLDSFAYGCVNVHGSLLPAYRGATPIQSAIADGLKETGITIMDMDVKLDAGDMYCQQSLGIGEDETYGSLHDRLGRLGGELVVEALTKLEAGTLFKTPQDDAAATYCTVLRREDEIIDWFKPGVAIHNRIRSLSPQPGAVAYRDNAAIKLLRTSFEDGNTPAAVGTILSSDKQKGVAVAVDGGILWLKEVQPAGKKLMDGDAWYRGLRDRNLNFETKPAVV